VMVHKTKKMLQCPQTLSSRAWWDLGTRLVSLRPFEGEEKGPGTHCFRMLRYPKNLRGSDITVTVYLSFDFKSSRSSNIEMAGLDG
jgi:hypothetical protein